MEVGRSSHGGIVKEENGVEPIICDEKEDVVVKDDKLGSTRAEMSKVKEENQRLKMNIERIVKDYRTLEMQFHDKMKQETTNLSDKASNHNVIKESDLVLLSLGRDWSERKKNESTKVTSEWKHDEQVKERLTLSLDTKFEVSKSSTTETSPNQSPVNSFLEQKDEAIETWPPSKVLKTMRIGDDEVTQINNAKKARVSVRARCDTPTMSDGCQWRKYGQKISKGNPCPRAYYRCTVAPNCPVRKQVQRCVDDMSILITTYEGQHNHPLPMSATAMASTTSAAASMLLSGSSGSSTTATTNSADLHGLKFYTSDHSTSKQFYLPNSISSSSSHPTITLDLTSTTPSSHSNGFSSRFPSMSLNFSSLESNQNPWSNSFHNYSSTQFTQHNQIGTSKAIERHPLENIYHSYLQKTNPIPLQQSLPADTIAAATKAITADPSFQSALVAALSTVISNSTTNGTNGASGNQGNGENIGQKLKWVEPFSAVSTHPKGNGCVSSYSQPGSLMFLPSSLPLPTSKSTSTSPGDNRDHST